MICWLVATIDTRSNGLFVQLRVGRNGKLFRIFKIKTMRANVHHSTCITQSGDPRITHIGSLFRKTKLDELPQLWNVLIGDMSLVGPRPDVPGYVDNLAPNIRNKILSVRPGITGPASLIYKNEEFLLASVNDPVLYNDEVIFPHKVKINLKYIDERTFLSDLKIIIETIFMAPS